MAGGGAGAATTAAAGESARATLPSGATESAAATSAAPHFVAVDLHKRDWRTRISDRATRPVGSNRDAARSKKWPPMRSDVEDRLHRCSTKILHVQRAVHASDADTPRCVTVSSDKAWIL